MDTERIREVILQQLPGILKDDPEIRDFVLRLSREHFADKAETESRFDRILDELRRNREEESRRWAAQEEKWAEQEKRWTENQEALRLIHEEENRRWTENQEALRLIQEEENRRWTENQEALRLIQEEENRRWTENQEALRLIHEEENRRWTENQEALRRAQEEDSRRWAAQEEKWAEQERHRADQEKRWQENEERWKNYLDEWRRDREEQKVKWAENDARFDRLLKRIDTGITAIGARWGLRSEQSFRNALKGILEESFKVEVLNVVEYDEAGEVFGRPEQVELDVVIKDGMLILCEIKSSISKSEMHTFYSKAEFYQKRHGRQASRLLVISPMVAPNAYPVAKKLGIQVYSYAEDVGPEVLSVPESET
jgi:hypothetical protein